MKKGNKANNKFKKVIIPTVIVSYGISLNANNIAYAREMNNNEVCLEVANFKELKNSLLINEENFPDKNFLAYVQENFDIDNDGILSNDEILKVKSISVKYKSIKSLKGIENFPNLTYINADYNYIEDLDLSKNYNLEVVLCNNNKLNNIVLPNDIENNKLVYLDIFSNVLTEVDLSNLKALEFLHIDDNRITHLDLSDNPLNEGHGFVAQNNYIEEITLPNNGTEYEWVKFLGTQLFPSGKEVGYKVKWYLDKDKTQELDPKVTETIICSGQTLYAEYVPITYTIEFNPGAGEGEIKTQEFTYGISENLLKNTYTRDGYIFNGWKDINEKIYKDEAELLNLTDIDGKVIKLTATWIKKQLGNSVINIKNESLDKVYDGTKVEDLVIEKTGSSKEVKIKWYEMKDSKWEEISDYPINAGQYKVVVSVEGDSDYEGIAVQKFVNIEKKNLTANEIILPEINEETDLEKLEIKDGDKVLEKDKDYDIVKTQEKNVVTIKITFKGNYCGEIIRNYTIEESNPSLPDEKPEEDKPVDGEEKPEVDKPVEDENTGTEEPDQEDKPIEENKPQINIDNINISNGVNNTNEFIYGDKIIIKFNINFQNKLLSKYLNSLDNEEREIALFANGVQITESQKVINGQEVIFEYDTRKEIIEANGDIELVIAYINENKESIEITKTNIKLNKKNITANDINIPEIDKETDLEKLEIKDGDKVLEKGKDYDIVKTQEKNVVTIKITFKGNYFGEIIKTYTLEESNPILPEEKPDSDKPQEDKPVEDEAPEIENPSEEDKPIDKEENLEENTTIEEIPGDEIVEVENDEENNSINNNESILPNTGSAISNNILLTISSMITAIGTTLVRRKNK